MNNHLASAPIAHHRHIIVAVWPGWLLKKESARTGASTQIGKSGNNLAGEMLEQHWIAVLTRLDMVNKTNIPASTIISVSPREHVHERVYRYVINITQPVGVNFHLTAIRPYANHSTSQHCELRPICSFGAYNAKISNRDINPTINPKADTIGRMIRSPRPVVFRRADVGNEDFAITVRNTVPILILEHGKMHRL